MAKSQLANNYRRERRMLNTFGALMFSLPQLEYFMRHECGGAVFNSPPSVEVGKFNSPPSVEVGKPSKCCGVFDRALPEDWANQFVHVYVWAQPHQR